MAVDPGDDTALEDPQRWNRYAYVGNSPIGYVDPDGRFSKPTHIDITRIATGSRALAQGVADVDNGFLGLPDATFNREGHFGSSDKADDLLQRSIDAELRGEHAKAQKLLKKALHLYQDDIGHRDSSGNRVGWWAHLFREIGDAFINDCKFSPDCELRPDFEKKKKAAIDKTRDKMQERKKALEGGAVSCYIPPDTVDEKIREMRERFNGGPGR